MAAQLNGPTTNGIATLSDQREATIAALRAELVGYRRSGKKSREDGVIAELTRLGVDVIAEEKAAAKAAADAEKATKQRAESPKPADVEQATA